MVFYLEWLIIKVYQLPGHPIRVTYKTALNEVMQILRAKFGWGK